MKRAAKSATPKSRLKPTGQSKATKSVVARSKTQFASGTSNVLGMRIRSRRKELELGLQDLASRTGLTASFISLVEREKTSPSLDSLIKIADALNVPFFHLTRSAPQLSRTNPVVRRAERVRLSFPQVGLTSELLVPNLRGRLEVVISTGLPHTGNIARLIAAHDAEEVIYVLEGSLKVELLLGVQPSPLVLNTGDSIHFHLSTLQGIYVEGRRNAVWMTIITPPVL